jgi:hypothetical protein
MKRLIAVALLACGSRAPSGPAPSGPAPSGGTAPRGGPCEAMRARVDQLYRSEAKDKEPARVDESAADNTAMVMSDCALAPDKVASCIAAAATVKDLEARCVAPIDDEGTEGDRLAR